MDVEIEARAVVADLEFVLPELAVHWHEHDAAVRIASVDQVRVVAILPESALEGVQAYVLCRGPFLLRQCMAARPMEGRMPVDRVLERDDRDATLSQEVVHASKDVPLSALDVHFDVDRRITGCEVVERGDVDLVAAAALHEARRPSVAVHRPGVCSAAHSDSAGPARSTHAHIVDSESVGELRRERAHCRSRTQLGRLGWIRLKGMNAGAKSKRAEQPERV